MSLDDRATYFDFTSKNLRDKLVFLKNMVRPILRFLPRNIRDFTDHGILHSKGILRILADLIPIVNKHCSYKIDEVDRFLLEACCYLHDIGNIKGPREAHGETTASLIESITEKHLRGPYKLTEDELYALMSISWSHQGNLLRLASLKGKSVSIQKKVDVGFLSALFRLADALDVGATRAPYIVFEVIKGELPEISRKHWQANQALPIKHPIGLDDDRGVILVFVPGGRRKYAKELILDRLNKELNKCITVLKKYGFPLVKVKFAEPASKGRVLT